jgi:ribosomal-protein-alanine N-acetyltransferase
MLETERLLIKPLTYSQLLKYVENNNSLEAELGVNVSNRVISVELKEALELAILPLVAEEETNYLFLHSGR